MVAATVSSPSGSFSAGDVLRRARAVASRSAEQDQRTIQLTIRNENATPITVFVWWQGGRRVRLGDLSGILTRTFTTAARDGGIWFEVEDQTTFTRVRRRRPDNYVPVGPGDHLEVITGRGGFILSVRRVPSL